MSAVAESIPSLSNAVSDFLKQPKQMLIDGKWVKATPAFNKALCDRFGLKPLEFDGINDSLFHEFDQAGNRHMEYLHERGTYADVPFAEIVETFREKYPNLKGRLREGIDGDFHAEAAGA